MERTCEQRRVFFWGGGGNKKDTCTKYQKETVKMSRLNTEERSFAKFSITRHNEDKGGAEENGDWNFQFLQVIGI